MKRIVTLLLAALLLLAPVAQAYVEGKEVQYVGGTVPNLSEGVVGTLDTSNEKLVTFQSATGKFEVPYEQITSFRYEERLARHYGVIGTIVVTALKFRQRRHILNISYNSPEGTLRTVVLEVSKDYAHVIVPIMSDRTPRSRQQLSYGYAIQRR
ncbi:MAG: hypothetical protein HY046_06335 [Acidobacteria bacterium]|nr:hypothetical protein [Acidobacteriota bacterium]